MGSLKVREKKKFPVFTLFFLILLCAAGFMFYMAFKEQVPYWISDYKRMEPFPTILRTGKRQQKLPIRKNHRKRSPKISHRTGTGLTGTDLKR